MGDEMNKVILISSDSYVLLEQELDKIVKTDNKMLYNLNESSLDDVLEEASYFSLFVVLACPLSSNNQLSPATRLRNKFYHVLLFSFPSALSPSSSSS